MAYTAAAWANLQKRLPPEDRVTYADYLASVGQNTETNTTQTNNTAASNSNANPASTSATPAPQPTLVDLAKQAGTNKDYSNLSTIIKDPAAYEAFTDARLERIKNERLANTPKKETKPPVTPVTPIPPTPANTGPIFTTPSVTSSTVSSTTTYTQTTVSYPPINPVPSTPSNINTTPPPPPPPPAKTAPIDTILYPSDDLLPIEVMADLIFENIGGQELINIARTDTVNGQSVVYQPIKNLTQIQQQYNPNNIVALQATSDKYFQNFAIKLEGKIPVQGTGPSGAHVYIDPTNGDLVIEAVNIQSDEQIELEITTSGTIYEAEL